MKLRLLVLITSLLALVPAQLHATSAPELAPYCVSLLVHGEPFGLHFNRAAVDSILSNRGAQLQEHHVFTVEGKRFETIGTLGVSSNTVFLARAEDGTRVVVKKTDPGDHITPYEILVTEYYLSQGLDVPRIIAADESQGIIVKEYVEGLIYTELVTESTKLFDDPGAAMRPLLRALDYEVAHASNVHEGFHAWLIGRTPKVSKHFLNVAKRLIAEGDMMQWNFLFSIKKHKWILFDP